MINQSTETGDDQFTVMNALAVTAQVYRAKALDRTSPRSLRLMHWLYAKECLRLAETMIRREIQKIQAQGIGHG